MSIKSLFENIANAIKNVYGTTDTLTPAEMPEAITNFNSIFQTKNLSDPISGQTTVEGCLSSLSSVLSELAADTGWQQLTSNIAYRKKGGVVYLNIFSGVTTNAWTLLGTLPSGYAPVANTTFTIICDLTSKMFGNILIDTSGNIYGLGNLSVRNAAISYIPASA